MAGADHYLGGFDEVVWTGFANIVDAGDFGDYIVDLPWNWCTPNDFNGDGRADFANVSYFSLDYQGDPLIRPDVYQFVGRGDGTFRRTHHLNGPVCIIDRMYDNRPGWFEGSDCYPVSIFDCGAMSCGGPRVPIEDSGEFPGVAEAEHIRITDFNGDRMADILNLDAGNQINYNTQLSNVSPDLLVRVSRGGYLAAEVDYVTSLTKFVKKQIAKDAELMADSAQDVSGVEWHFFPGKTGVGPTGPLREALENNGISIVIH